MLLFVIQAYFNDISKTIDIGCRWFIKQRNHLIVDIASVLIYLVNRWPEINPRFGLQ